MSTTSTATRPDASSACAYPLAVRVTRSLLGYGVLAGPFYLTVSLAQVFTRDGFDPTRHSWSLLANGSHGWIQIANFILSGLMTLAAAVGLGRALRPGRAATWAGRLVGAYGVALIGAGLLRADPALGFPVGTPDGPGTVSWHGVGHLLAGAVGFLCVIVATFVVAHWFAARGTPCLGLVQPDLWHRVPGRVRGDRLRQLRTGHHPGLRRWRRGHLDLAERRERAPVPDRRQPLTPTRVGDRPGSRSDK